MRPQPASRPNCASGSGIAHAQAQTARRRVRHRLAEPPRQHALPQQVGAEPGAGPAAAALAEQTQGAEQAQGLGGWGGAHLCRRRSCTSCSSRHSLQGPARPQQVSETRCSDRWGQSTKHHTSCCTRQVDLWPRMVQRGGSMSVSTVRLGGGWGRWCRPSRTCGARRGGSPTCSLQAGCEGPQASDRHPCSAGPCSAEGLSCGHSPPADRTAHPAAASRMLKHRRQGGWSVTGWQNHRGNTPCLNKSGRNQARALLRPPWGRSRLRGWAVGGRPPLGRSCTSCSSRRSLQGADVTPAGQ